MQTIENRPLVLVIAGVDSGGGAGISCDIMSIYDNKAFALPIVSSLTSQSLSRVTGCENVSNDIFLKSLELAYSDWEQGISAIKVGFIASNSILDILLSKLKTDFKDVDVVWDPVLTATAGNLDSVNLKDRLDEILSLVTIFTPNLVEALELASWDRERLDKDGIEELASIFIKKGAKNVIIKGGHRADKDLASDFFLSQTHSFTMSHKRQDGLGAHGGGCSFSSTLAALIANKYAPFDAAVLAKGYVYSGIVNPALPFNNKERPPIGHNGFISSVDLLPKVTENNFPKFKDKFLPCPHNLGLYPVVDSVEWIERLLKQGVKTIQLRIKDKEDVNLFEKIQKAVALGEQYKARVFIDDHYELAIKAHAYGVHLGMEDLQVANLDAIHKANLRLGVSTHGVYELCKALSLNPSYIALGHIFPTQTKDMPSKPQGVEKLRVQANMLVDVVPTVAIGGIKLDKAQDILDTKVGSIAVVTAITKAQDVESETHKWLSKVGCGDD